MTHCWLGPPVYDKIPPIRGIIFITCRGRCSTATPLFLPQLVYSSVMDRTHLSVTQASLPNGRYPSVLFIHILWTIIRKINNICNYNNNNDNNNSRSGCGLQWYNPQTALIKEYFVEVCSNTTLMLSMISYDIYLLLPESDWLWSIMHWWSECVCVCCPYSDQFIY